MKWLLTIVVLLIGSADADNQTDPPVSSSIVGLNWHHVQSPFLLSCWLLLACFAKIRELDGFELTKPFAVFHVNKKFGDAIPDSALLIAVGLFLGFILNVLQVNHQVFYLPSEIFFLYLLPPIIFDAGYFMPIRDLWDNAGSVLVFSVFGTIWNTVAIGATLALFAHYDFFTVQVNTEDSLLFSSLISAVDPVAVITVFEEVHVNEFLFINVFGEALFNDGIAAVLFQIFKRVSLIGIPNLKAWDYVSFGGSFFAVALGGIFIGIVFAAICAIATKYTVGPVKIVGPVFAFVFPYLSYLTAEMFGLSAILAICCCGITMKQYVKGNLSHEAASSVKYFIKMLSNSSETVVFMFLGLSTMSSDLVWDWWFIGVTLISCLVYRALGLFSMLIECSRRDHSMRNIELFFEQESSRFKINSSCLMAVYVVQLLSGLLSSVPNQVVAKDIFTTTTLVVICVTVFLQGTTVRPLLHFLKVETKEEVEETMAENVFNKYFDYTMAGIEDIIDQHSGHSFRDWFEHINAKIIKPILMRDYESQGYDASTIVRAYQKMAITDAMNMVQKSESTSTGTGATARIENRSQNGMTTIRIQDSIDPKQTEGELFDMFNELLDRRLAQFHRDSVPNPRDDICDEYRPAHNNYNRYQHQLNEANDRRQSQPQNLYRIRPTDNQRNETKF
ncbi:hypothetical protein M3Y94_00020100 [Aphelenchoides besseyi]|nr:hypothetical protein M3Y94_00020100 [Aphelenchoides besseyi]